jgi:RHS repeat-associated protein
LQIDQVLAQENSNGEVLWALTDHQGSVKMLLDHDGSVVNNITYDTFGNVTIETNPDINFRFGYTGREHDDETGLDYYGARYRDPGLGRFISEDTRYTFNSPLNYTDSDGNFAAAVVVGGAALAVVGVVGIWYFNDQLQKFLEQPKTVIDPPYDPPTTQDDERKLLPPPVRPDPEPETEREERKAPPNPNDEECDKKTCKDVYPQYDRLSDYIGNQFPFGGFKYDNLSEATNGIRFNRQNHSQIGDPRDVQLGNSAPMDTIIKDPQIKFLENLKDPEKSGIHYNVFISGVQPDQSAGSIGEYKFCKEGNPPELVPASIILNIKDNNGTKYYQRG